MTLPRASAGHDEAPDGLVVDVPASCGEPERDRTQRMLVVLVVALLSGLFLLNASSWLAAPFGESHDGGNAATWGLGTRALRDDGIVESRFGGRYDGARYASHPPGLVAETTLLETVAGEHRLVTRAPAWIASIAVAVLLALLLWELGLSAGAIAIGLGTSLGSAMFLVYGTMLDTPVTALPYALAFVLVVQKVVDGGRARPWLLAVLGAAVALSGWAAVVIAGFQLLRLLRHRVRERIGWLPALAGGAGLVAGLVVSFAWGLWVYGSFTTMHEKLTQRSTEVSLVDSLAEQLGDIRALLPLAALLAVLGVATAWTQLADRRWAGAFGSTLGAVALYAVVMRGGAQVHDYWDYALIVPVAIAVAAGAEALLRRVPADARSRAQVGAVVLGLAIAVGSSTVYSDAEAELENALATPRLLDATDDIAPADGPVLGYMATGALDVTWISYESGRPALPIRSTGQLEDLVAEEPDFPVLVPWVVYPDPEVQAEAKDVAYAVDGPYAVVPAEFILSLRTD